MKRFLSLLAAVALVLPAGSLLGAPAQANNATPARPVTMVDDFRACIAGGGVTDMLLLVDESASLGDRDPENGRVTAADYLVKQLAGFTDGVEGQVNISISVFADQYRSVKGWTTLSPATLPELQDSIASLKTMDKGMETDYWTALDGARRDLAARASSRTDVQSCQAVVWFSDGGLNFVPRTTDAAKQAYGTAKAFAPNLELTNVKNTDKARELAADDICRGGGVADQLRSSHVAMFGIGLGGSKPEEAEFDFMKSVATGFTGQGGSECGNLTDPAPGEFHLASGIDSLLLAFDAISSPGRSPMVQEHGICQFDFCEDQSHRFVLDATTPKVRILATADADEVTASMVSPAGKIIGLPLGDLNKEVKLSDGGNTIAYTWLSEKTLTVSMGAGPTNTAWSGLWQLGFTDPSGTSKDKVSKSSVHITGNLVPVWLNPAETPLHVGDTIPNVKFGLADTSGKAVQAAGLLGSVKLSATMVGAQGKATEVARELDKNSLGSPRAMDLKGLPVGPAQMRLALTITTAATTYKGQAVPGTLLEPAMVSIPVQLTPPADFPVLGSAVDFGQAEGLPHVRGTLSTAGSGCVWLPAEQKLNVVASPADIGKTSITMDKAASAENCISVSGGSPLALTFTAENAGNGTVNGTVTMMIAPDGESAKAMPVEVAFTASLAKPLNTANFLLALFVALILGPGIPLLLLYLAKWMVAKIPGSSLSAELIPINVSHGQVERDGAPFALRPSDLVQLVPMDPSGTRSLMLLGVEFKAKTGLSPLGTGYVSVISANRFSVSSAHPGADKTGTQARLPLAIHNNWVLLRDEGSDPQTGYVLILASGDISASGKQAMEGDIRSRLPELLGQLNDAAAEPLLEPVLPSGSSSAGPTGSPDGGFGGFARGQAHDTDGFASGGSAGFGGAGQAPQSPIAGGFGGFGDPGNGGSVPPEPPTQYNPWGQPDQ
ncbi:VWA domain-containing protein [Arthrobacter sp.]|uniref:VWA domain-containing protein n=1 Tax=Arthrobacter sp. TaxID=1667 RepID=UPI0026E113F7|nr:VWA domain-containing protein [Arthrobacter sp.]MDO5752288.1 VWA domain-containing protein [Arthrobacter sp.]